MAAAGRPTRPRAPAREGVPDQGSDQPLQLLGMPPMNTRRDLCACSSVAYRATGEAGRILDLVLLHEPAPEGELVVRQLPFAIEDLRVRPDLALRVAVAVQAPFHQEGRHLIGERHFV